MRTRRAVVGSVALVAIFVVLATFGAAAWCDEERFGTFVQASFATGDVPAHPFTEGDLAAYPDVAAALARPGTPVRAADPEAVARFFEGLDDEGVAAVRLTDGTFYVASFEQQPSETWTRVCA